MPERRGVPTQPSITSPCIRNCCLDENNICLGCHRSLTEICAWGEASKAERQEIMQHAALRKQQRHHNSMESR